MAARKRAFDESYEDYKLNIREEEKLIQNKLMGQYTHISGAKLSTPIPVSSLKRHNM